MSLLDQIRAVGVVPVIVIEDAAQAVPLAEALLAGGLPIAEITFRTPAAAQAIARIAEKVPQVLVGAGTLLDPASVAAAARANARFGLAPGFDPDIVDTASEHDLPFMPGFATPSELTQAVSRSIRALKFFPAGPLGGPTMLKSVVAPFAHLDLHIIPTGGVTQDNMGDWLALPEIMAVGGTWIATKDDLARGDFAAITEKARAAVEKAKSLRG